MMKLLAVALLVLVCISVAVVDGRKNKRGKDRLEHLEKRREFRRNRMKGKPNVVEPSNDAVANKKEDAKASPVISNDAKAQKAQKPSHDDKRDFKNHHKKREFKHNQAKFDLDQMENFHKRHHGNKLDMHPNDVKMIRKGKMSREMLVDRDLPEAEITKRMMKLMKKRAKHQMRNHSHHLQKRRDQKRRLKENAP